MVYRIRRLCGVGAIGLWLCQASHADPAAFVPLAERTNAVLDALTTGAPENVGRGVQRLDGAVKLQIRGCSGYPYNEGKDPARAARLLIGDLHTGLQTGLRCLAGQGPMGRLHPYHEYQAHRLLSLMESDQPKTFQCVEDAMFATAVATSPRPPTLNDPLHQQLSKVAHPGVILDTYRLGGILSRNYDDETYRSFFHLRDSQILEHRNGQPLRPANLHRYQDRAGLLFHEVIHWLGHQHSATHPDLAHLYETCCFAGSDYISDPERNRRHQQAACNILKDDELWSEGYSRYRQMRLWHYKGYTELKSRMRDDYDS